MPAAGAQEPTESGVIPARSSTRAKAMKKGDLVRAKVNASIYVRSGSAGVIVKDPQSITLGVNGCPTIALVHWFDRGEAFHARTKRLEVISEER
jgi:hypothetical protein